MRKTSKGWKKRVMMDAALIKSLILCTTTTWFGKISYLDNQTHNSSQQYSEWFSGKFYQWIVSHPKLDRLPIVQFPPVYPGLGGQHVNGSSRVYPSIEIIMALQWNLHSPRWSQKKKNCLNCSRSTKPNSESFPRQRVQDYDSNF